MDLELAIADKCYPNPEDRTGDLQVELHWGTITVNITHNTSHKNTIFYSEALLHCTY